MPTVLVVDDEPPSVDVVSYALAGAGLRVRAAGDGVRALEILDAEPVDLVVLDVVLPELDGLSLCRRLRAARRAVPIVFLSSRGEEVDRILGLELGGDDYLAKPFSPRELVSRVQAVLRRSAGAEAGGGVVHGRLTIDVAAHRVCVGGARVELTPTEFGVLLALLERPGRVLSRAQLIDRAYRHDNHITERTIDTHVRRLRGKLRRLGVDPVETVFGLGYRAAAAS
jgi:two-component system OmpR family response regulator